jgi:hypothetical protein
MPYILKISSKKKAINPDFDSFGKGRKKKVIEKANHYGLTPVAWN